MNSNDRPARYPANPMEYVTRRLASLAVVGGAITGFLTAGLLESAGLPGPVAVGAGLLAFVVGTSLASGLAARHKTRHRREGSL